MLKISIRRVRRSSRALTITASYRTPMIPVSSSQIQKLKNRKLTIRLRKKL